MLYLLLSLEYNFRTMEVRTMNNRSELLRLRPASYASVPAPRQGFLAARSAAGGWLEVGNQKTLGLLFLLCAIFLVQGCAKPYASVVRHYREDPVCCDSMAELPIDELQAGDRKSFDLGAGSPAYQFDTGKSYFRAYLLPLGGYPYRVTIRSYLVGDYLKSAYLFFPQLITLDERRKVVRSTGPGTFTVTRTNFIERVQTAGDFNYKVEGGLTFTETNRDERYLVVLTTDELLRIKTPVPSAEVPMLLLGSTWTSSAKASEVMVPHAPGGKVSVSLSPLAPDKPSAQNGEATTGVDNAIAVAKSETSAVPKHERARGGEKAPSSVRPETLTVRLATGRIIGRLELGKTGTDEARRLFEYSGAGLGPERKSSTTFTVGTTTLTPEQLFIPPGTLHQLYFDNNGILVLFVDGSAAEIPSSGRVFRQRFSGARETGRVVGSYELQADLTSCETLIAVFRTVGDSLDSVAYAYGCPTK